MDKQEQAELLEPKFRYQLSEHGCRPCCSFPHGGFSLVTAIIASIAWIFSTVAVQNCNFLAPADYLYCYQPPPAPPKYGTCGDCHCINGENPCPSDPDEIPLVDVPDPWLKQLESMEALNPYKMTCNPYNTTGGFEGNCTDPPQLEYQLELWETAACGIKYDMSALDEDQCPTQYTMKTYDTEEEMIEDGAYMTHWGACGACSTTKDLAVYLKYPDLTGKGQECGLRGLVDFNDGVACFQEVDYTYECAVMWMYNVFNTRDNCLGICLEFTFLGDGANNGPPPECRIANCLLCDEQMSGPIFQTVAARSRRRSGLLSKIVRPCENLLIVDHQEPCNVTRELLLESDEGRRDLQASANSDTRITPPPKFTEPPPKETCVYVNTQMGLSGYSGTENNQGLFDWITGTDSSYRSLYETCYRYDFARVISGYWKDQKNILGAAYNAALTFGTLAVLLGVIWLALLWCTTCVAFGPRFWKFSTGLFVLLGVFMLFTLLFFASEICSNGCQFGAASGFAVASAIMWFCTATCAYYVEPFNKQIPKATCCCCPVPIIDGQPAVYSHIPSDDTDSSQMLADATEIELTTTTREDGSTVTEKVTKLPSGRKLMERTIQKTINS